MKNLLFLITLTLGLSAFAYDGPNFNTKDDLPLTAWSDFWKLQQIEGLREVKYEGVNGLGLPCSYESYYSDEHESLPFTVRTQSVMSNEPGQEKTFYVKFYEGTNARATKLESPVPSLARIYLSKSTYNTMPGIQRSSKSQSGKRSPNIPIQVKQVELMIDKDTRLVEMTMKYKRPKVEKDNSLFAGSKCYFR